MSLEQNARTLAQLDRFELSRIGASIQWDEYRLTCHLNQVSGAGIRIDALCAGQSLSFWLPESDWCAWLAPQVALSSCALIEPELLMVLAAWSLTPLNELLASLNLAPCTAVQMAPAPAPDGVLWQLCLHTDECRLPLSLLDVPLDWRDTVLQALEPDTQYRHRLSLALGWCLISSDEWQQLAVGDALPISGMGEALDCFWLHPTRSPGRVRLMGERQAQVLDCASGQMAAPSGALCLSVEVGYADIAASELASWQPEQTLALSCYPHPVLQLTAQGQLMALGELLKFDDAWAVRVQSR